MKPAGSPTYFVETTDFSATPETQVLWGAAADIWFAPTQVLATVNLGTGAKALVLEVTGKDQFGYPVDETLEITSTGTAIFSIGTKRCYTYIDTMTVVSSTNISISDTFAFGVGSDDDDKYRVPVPARIRDVSEFLGIQDVTEGEFYTSTSVTVDAENQAVEIDLGTNPSAEKHLAVILEPATTSI